ncbi:hypothetical protein CEB3_c40540 [Peptococcaceae bacterium CEB3]|nr:hypothetical protein CEB3_c40540 [Peptococcaceae bacterium CEB3]
MSPENDKGTTVEERKQTLLEAREEILMKYKTEKEQRLQWLVRFMDIEDELEELARLENRRTILGNLTSAGNSRRWKAKSY